MKEKLLILLTTVLACGMMHASTVRVFGYVIGDDNRSIDAANVYSGRGADIVGTATNKNGFYELVLNYEDTIVMTYSMVGYTTVVQRIIRPQEVTHIDVTMMTDEQWLQEVEIRGQKKEIGTLDAVDAEATRLMPDATGGSIESILITFAGVNQNNELSSQYNVRGGTFDENVVYVNGIEIHRPLLYRSGQQEGLSCVNPYMVERVNFSAGGFDAQYGDKMASVLDIEYKTPTKAEGNITASLLGGSVYFGHGNKRFSQMHGLRYKTNRYMLGAMGGSGNYNPNFLDYQTVMSWSLNSKKTRNNDWRMTVLANISRNDYTYQPESYAENWGGTDHSTSLDIWYDGQEKDLFLTTMGAIGVSGHISPEVTLGFNANGFYASEQENYDISAEYELTGDGDSFGTGNYHNHARNRLQEGVAVFAHTGSWAHGGNTLRWGLSAQGEWIKEQVREWQWRDSAGYSMPTGAKELEMYYAMNGSNSLNTYRIQGYIQNTHEWNTTSAGKWILTAGMRLQYWSGNREWMPSPRASLTWFPGWKHDVAIRLAGGLYYQAPFYKELRDTLTTDGVTRVTLNRDSIKAQRAAHAVLGVDYYFRGGGRPFKLSGEVYYKYIDRMESYTVDNVRVQYSGENDAKGYTVGADLKLYGELVPGADSWISVGWMHSKMKILDHPEYGWLSSPQEQRFSFSMFFQDYIPKLPQLRFHLKMIFAENLPFAVPRHIETIQHAKMSFYKRIDIGATYQFDRKTTRFMRAESAKHIRQWAIGLECFNLVGWNNVSDYFWVQDDKNRYWRCPNYLTGRRINLKVTIDFQ